MAAQQRFSFVASQPNQPMEPQPLDPVPPDPAQPSPADPPGGPPQFDPDPYPKYEDAPPVRPVGIRDAAIVER